MADGIFPNRTNMQEMGHVAMRVRAIHDLMESGGHLLAADDMGAIELTEADKSTAKNMMERALDEYRMMYHTPEGTA